MKTTKTLYSVSKWNNTEKNSKEILLTSNYLEADLKASELQKANQYGWLYKITIEEDERFPQFNKVHSTLIKEF